MPKIEMLYVRTEAKVHSVIYSPAVPSPDQPLEKVYIKKASGITDTPRLRITVETLDN